MNLQKQKTDVEMELERKSNLLDEQTNVTKRMEEKSYQLVGYLTVILRNILIIPEAIGAAR